MVGMNKLIVNNLNKLFVTNDAGTILKELEVEHPAARLIVQASQQQDRECGDGTNLVVVLAGELLAQGERLLRQGLKASVVVEGYELAQRRAQDILGSWEESREVLGARHVAGLREGAGEEPSAALGAVLRSVIGSKQPGLEGRLGGLVEEALRIALPGARGRFDADNVRCVKLLGGSLQTSHVVRGMVFGREPSSRSKTLRDAQGFKVAVFACGIAAGRTETKGTVLLQTAPELLQFAQGEEAQLEAQIAAVAASGARVVVTGEAVSELALHFLDRQGLLVLRVPSKFDLRRLARAVGATPLARLGAPLAEELGEAVAVEAAEFGADRCTVVRTATGRLATLVLRGSTQNALDDLERSVEDAVGAVRTLLAGPGHVLPGAGACDVALGRALQRFAAVTPGIEQHAIRAFAAALGAVPRQLALNAGADGVAVVDRLTAAQDATQDCNLGVDVCDPAGEPLDALAAGIFDVLGVKRTALQLAVDAALTILRTDQIIMSKPAGGPKPPAGRGGMDDD